MRQIAHSSSEDGCNDDDVVVSSESSVDESSSSESGHLLTSLSLVVPTSISGESDNDELDLVHSDTTNSV